MKNLAAGLLACLLSGTPARAEEGKSPSAFELERNKNVKTSIDLKEVMRGTRKADPKDAIPAIWKPEAVAAAEATWVKPGDRVLGVVMGKEARAYPLNILEVHEMVNDVLGGKPIAPNY